MPGIEQDDLTPPRPAPSPQARAGRALRARAFRAWGGARTAARVRDLVLARLLGCPVPRSHLGLQLSLSLSLSLSLLPSRPPLPSTAPSADPRNTAAPRLTASGGAPRQRARAATPRVARRGGARGRAAAGAFTGAPRVAQARSPPPPPLVLSGHAASLPPY